MEDNKLALDVQNLLRLIESEFTEATLALNLFNNERHQFEPHSEEQWHKDMERRQQLRFKYEKQHDVQAFNFENHEEISNLVEIELKREKWAAGESPKRYKHARAFLYAKSFLNNLATLGRLLKVLSNTKGVPVNIRYISKKFFNFFPQLREVRNSAQHIEDRGRGLGSDRKPMDLKPVNNQAIKSDGGVLILNQLNGNRYGNTMADGHYGEVEVSSDSLKHVQECIQRVIDSFKWKGPKSHYPT